MKIDFLCDCCKQKAKEEIKKDKDTCFICGEKYSKMWPDILVCWKCFYKRNIN